MDKGSFTHLNLRAIAEERETYELYFDRIHRRRKGAALFPEHEPLGALEEIRREVVSLDVV